MIETLTAGVILGTTAGFAPGPLLALVLNETLLHGWRAGIRVAIAPVITDAPIIALAIFLSIQFSDARLLLGVIALTGGSFVLWMGITSLKRQASNVVPNDKMPKSLARGIITNALSPHPYLFWLTVGMPILHKATETSAILPMVFILSFYLCLVGAKIVLAVLAGRTRGFLKGKSYRYLMKTLGLILCVFALLLYRDGLHLLGIIH
jgi:threonine/homoserine/homoserine lactone efflux protein